MSSISQLKKSGNSIKFKINNKKDNQYEIGLINSIRRAIIAHLEIYSFLRKSINFSINTSIYNEDFLSQRVSLIPLNMSKLDKLNLEEIEGHFSASNEDPIEFKKYYAKDIILYYGSLDSPVEERKTLENIYPIPDILLLELKPGQKLKFTIKIGKANHKDHGAMFCPVSKCLYHFEPDVKALQQAMTDIPVDKKKDFELLNEQRYYLKTDIGLPSVYNFEIETDGVMPIGTIFSRGLDYLINLLKTKIDEIKAIDSFKPDAGEKQNPPVVIETSPTNMVGYDFVFENSNETLGNILQSYGLREKDIEYIGYNVPHPLDKRLYLRISMGEGVERKVYEKKVISIMEKVVDIYEKLRKDYMSVV